MVAPEISQPAFRQLRLNEKQHLKGKREEMRLKAEKRKQKQKNKGKKRVSNSGAGSSSQEKRHRTDLWRGLEMTEDRDVIYMCQGNKCGIKIPFPWRTWTADELESGRPTDQHKGQKWKGLHVVGGKFMCGICKGEEFDNNIAAPDVQ
jgi:rubrerythrin